MTPEIYNMTMELSMRVGKMLGTVGAILKYSNSGLNDSDFKSLANTYIECSKSEQDIAEVRAQAEKRGIDLT